MGRFIAPATATVHPFKDQAGWHWAVSDSLIWEMGGGAAHFIVPQGFLTDLGSLPWWARAFFNPADPQAAWAYVLHDYLLSLLEHGYTSQFAASQLYEALAYQGVGLLSRKIQYAGVVLGIAEREW